MSYYLHFINELELVTCKNDALYHFLYLARKIFLIKFKDNKSINLVSKAEHQTSNINY